MFKSNHMNFEKGVSIYLAIMVMTILLGIGFGMSALLVGQFKVLRGIGESVFAFYAADGGIERVLQVDTCMGKTVEADRIACIRAAIDDTAFSDPNCNGSPITNAEECRRQAMNLFALTLVNGSSYTISIVNPGVGACPSGITYCGQASGTFRQAVRKIQISR